MEAVLQSNGKIYSHRVRRFVVAILLSSIGVLGGCSTRPDAGFLISTSDDTAIGAEHHVLIATTREKDPRAGTFFGGERSGALNYASFRVAIPPTHVAGNVEWPASPPGNPAKEFVVRDGAYIESRTQFIQKLNRELEMRKPGSRKVLLFVHGYNTLFAEGLYRLAQISHDSGSAALPVLFTWASRGHVRDYIYDTNSATIARDDLETTIRDLVSSKAEQVNIVAHSMGNWVLVEALRQIRISNNTKGAEKVGIVILAAPDIDIDVFKSQMRRFGKPKRPFLIVLSKDDKALAVSNFLAGGRTRLGADGDLRELQQLGALVIDLSNARSPDGLNHGKFAELASVAPQLREVLERGIARPIRPGAGAEKAGDGLGALISTSATVLGTPIRVIGAAAQ